MKQPGPGRPAPAGHPDRLLSTQILYHSFEAPFRPGGGFCLHNYRVAETWIYLRSAQTFQDPMTDQSHRKTSDSHHTVKNFPRYARTCLKRAFGKMNGGDINKNADFQNVHRNLPNGLFT